MGPTGRTDDQKCADRDSYPPHFSGLILRDVQVKIYTLDRRPTVEFSLREGGDTMATLDQAQEPDKNYPFYCGDAEDDGGSDGGGDESVASDDYSEESDADSDEKEN